MWRSVSGSPSSEDALSARERSFGVTCRSEPRSSAEAEVAEAAGAAEGEEASASMTWLRLVQKLEHCQREEERCRNDRNANHSQQRDPARVHDPQSRSVIVRPHDQPPHVLGDLELGDGGSLGRLLIWRRTRRRDNACASASALRATAAASRSASSSVPAFR
jgi:hypothetical protein